MYAEERQDRIERVIAVAGRVAVVDLAREFDVTTETVRRDLAQLAERGALRRVHGGAVASTGSASVEEPVTERRDLNAAAKRRIAHAAMAMIPPTFRGAIALDGGTTTGALAEQLARWTPSTPGRSLLVITNSVGVASTLSENPDVEVRLLGGRVRRLTGASVGQSTVAQLSTLRPEIAFLGANGVHAEFGLSTPDEEEAAVKSAFARAARRTVSLVDASKLGKESLVQFADLDEISSLITDQEPPTVLADALRDKAVELQLA